MKRFTLILLLAVCAGCGATHPRFAERDVVWELDDRQPIPEPADSEFYIRSYFGDILLFDRVMRALSLHDLERAHNVNAMDGVPNSSWFTNRLGMFDLSPERVARGPIEEPPPSPPYRVVRAKSRGSNPGFVMEDASGRTFIVKFDTPENPEMQTGTNQIVNRIFWAAGYNVPADYIFWFDPAEVSPGEGEEAPDQTAIDDILSRVARAPDGRYRATASQFLDGKPKGGFTSRGRRPDDPNDPFDHQHRRELRGLRAVAAWLNHTDIKDDNTVDMYVGEPGEGHIVHYFVDFGEAMGGHVAEKGRKDDGYEYTVDWSRQGLALLALGFWKRPWEDDEPTPWPAVGIFSAEGFDPSYWREAYPYLPFAEATREDLFWGARIVTSFEEEHIRAVVEGAHYTDPAAAEYVVQTLLARRDAIGRTWLDGVTSLTDFHVRGRAICMTDLAVARGYAAPSHVEELRGALVRARHAVGPDGAICIPAPDEGYEVVRLRTVREDGRRPPLQLHVRGGTAPDVLGVVRVED